MNTRVVRRVAALPAAAAALLLATAPAAAYPTAGTATLNGTFLGGPEPAITGAMQGDVEIVDPVSPPGQANLVIEDTCTLSLDATSSTAGTIAGTCTGSVSIQLGAAYTLADAGAGGELVARGAAAINTYDDVNVDLACTLDTPLAACTVEFQG